MDQDFLKQLPRRPGVYLMKDREDKVLYVGKAVNLYNRVRSYFQSSRQLSPRIAHMVEQVDRWRSSPPGRIWKRWPWRVI